MKQGEQLRGFEFAVIAFLGLACRKPHNKLLLGRHVGVVKARRKWSETGRGQPKYLTGIDSQPWRCCCMDLMIFK
jgi:hypothetical protein